MALRTFFVLLTFFLAANAAPMQHRQPTNRQATMLSNEVIIGLVSLFVAVFSISITLVASPKMRKNIKNCITRNRRHSMEQLRQQYNEFQEFRAYVAMSAM